MDIKKAIRALLQTKFGGAQLSQARVDELAKRLEGKVNTEEELEAKMTAMDEIMPFAEIAREDDRQRSLQAELEKLKSKKDNKPEDEKNPEGEGGSKEDDAPEWAKVLIESNKELTDKIAALEGQKIVNDRKAAILAKLEGADSSYSEKVLKAFNRMSFKDDDDFNSYLSEVETDYQEFIQSQAESQLGKDAPFISLTDAKGQVSEAKLDEIVNNL